MYGKRDFLLQNRKSYDSLSLTFEVVEHLGPKSPKGFAKIQLRKLNLGV